jgi:hypothetical protein
MLTFADESTPETDNGMPLWPVVCAQAGRDVTGIRATAVPFEKTRAL